MIAVGMATESSDGSRAHSARRRMRLSRSCRLTRTADFDEAFATDRGHAGRYLVLRYRKSPDSGRRVGVVASKRTFRRAVDRARAKRLLREAFRLSRDRVAVDVDLVLIARRRILAAKCGDVRRDLVKLIRRAGVALNEKSGAETHAG